LHHACQGGHAECVKSLIYPDHSPARPARWDIRDRNGKSCYDLVNVTTKNGLAVATLLMAYSAGSCRNIPPDSTSNVPGTRASDISGGTQQHFPAQLYPAIPSHSPHSTSSATPPPSFRPQPSRPNDSDPEGGWGQAPSNEWGAAGGVSAVPQQTPSPMVPSPITSSSAVNHQTVQRPYVAQPQQAFTRVLSLRDNAPSHFICPITADVMFDPVFASDG